MEDDLNILKMEDDFKYVFENGRRPQIFLKMEDDLHSFENGI